jgi:hypothetical protein
MAGSERSFTTYDLLDIGLLPAGWDLQVTAVADEYGTLVHLDGNNPDSSEPTDSEGMDYHVVTGDIVAKRLPWLLHLYRSHLTDLASAAVGASLRCADQIKHGININVLKGAQARYEWHVDPNPVSGVLYVTTHHAEEGGGLLLESGDEVCIVQPQAGAFVVFEGGSIRHSVASLAFEQVRISIPLLFYYADQEQRWPDELEAYLYGR